MYMLVMNVYTHTIQLQAEEEAKKHHYMLSTHCVSI